MHLEIYDIVEDFYFNQKAYCYNRRRTDGFIHCVDCVNSSHCKWKKELLCDTLEYCENFNHIEDCVV